jgi:putative effector of murein hydrolase LrgA (UPF0299 family)
MKTMWYFNMWIHRIWGLAILVLTVVFSILGILKSGGIKKELHSLMGFIVLLLVPIIVLGGFVARSKMNGLKW